MVLVEMWAFGLGFLAPISVAAGVVALVVFFAGAKKKDGSSREAWQGSASFLAAFILVLAVLAFRQSYSLLPTYFLDATSAETVRATMASAKSHASGLALKYVLPACVALGLVGLVILEIRRRWVQWLLATAASSALCVYIGFLDCLFRSAH